MSERNGYDLIIMLIMNILCILMHYANYEHNVNKLLLFIITWYMKGLIEASQGPRPAIPVPLNGAGASTPQRQEALPYLCDWDYGAGGWEKHEKPQSQGKALPYRIPTGWGKGEKERRSADGPDPEKSHRTDPQLRGRDPPPTNCRDKPPSHPCCRRATWATIWAATLAPSQAGANYTVD